MQLQNVSVSFPQCKKDTEEKKKVKEANKQKHHNKQKKLVEEFHSRKRLEDGIMLSRIDDLANDLLKEKLSRDSLNP